MLISFEPLLKSCGHLGFSLKLKRCKDNLQQLLGLDNHIYSKKYVGALYRVILHDRIFFFFKTYTFWNMCRVQFYSFTSPKSVILSPE